MGQDFPLPAVGCLKDQFVGRDLELQIAYNSQLPVRIAQCIFNTPLTQILDNRTLTFKMSPSTYLE